VLADLPGYGYAAVPKQDKIRWQQVMANYLVTRENLKAIVLMCDPRHGLTELDEILLEVVRPRVEEGLKFLVVLTKADKLTRSEQSKALSIMKLQAGGGEVRLFSATKRQGIDDVATLLWQWAHPPETPSNEYCYSQALKVVYHQGPEALIGIDSIDLGSPGGLILEPLVYPVVLPGHGVDVASANGGSFQAVSASRS
jgi:GTPase Era involved in 16S rRNA processing